MQNPRNFGGLGKAVYAGKKEDIVAASGTDNVEVLTDEIDRLQDGALARSCKLVIPWNFTLAEAETAKLHVDIKHCDTSGGSYSADAEVYALTTICTGLNGGAAQYGCFELDLDLEAYNRFVKFNITCDLSASGSDAGDWAAACVLGGFDVEPT